MSDEELNRIMAKADDDLDRLKDRCHELHEENEELKTRINKAIEFIKEKRKEFEWYDTDLFYLESLLQESEDKE